VATIIAGDILKATVVVQGLQGQVALPSVHYAVGITAGAPQDVDLATHFDSFAAAVFLPLLNNKAKYLGTISQKIFPLPIFERTVANTAAGFGTGGAAPAPQQTAPVISFSTPLAGPSQRGRWKQPFPPDDLLDTTTGELSAVYKTKLQTWGNFMLAATTIGSGANLAAVNLIIWHSELDTFDVVSTALARDQVGTQKSRGNFGKQNVSPI